MDKDLERLYWQKRCKELEMELKQAKRERDAFLDAFQTLARRVVESGIVAD